jgi:hypothetical protein
VISTIGLRGVNPVGMVGMPRICKSGSKSTSLARFQTARVYALESNFIYIMATCNSSI